MATGQDDDRPANSSPAAPRSRLGAETVLAVAGALVAIGFFLPWFDLPGSGERLSGLDITRRGGVWTGLAALPALGALTALLGGLRTSLSRYLGFATGIALLVPLGYVLATQWPWLLGIPLVGGAVLVVVGKLGRAPWLNAPLGGALVVLTAVAAVSLGDEPVFDLGRDTGAEQRGGGGADGDAGGDGGGAGEAGESNGDAKGSAGDPPPGDTATGERRDGLGAVAVLSVGMVGPGALDGLGVVAAVPLVLLVVLVPLCGLWLLWSGLRKKGLQRPVVVTGWVIVALDVYVAAIVVFGPTLVTAGPGLWMTALGGVVVLIGSRPLASRRNRAQARTRHGEADGAKKADAKKNDVEKADAKKADAKNDAKKADAKKTAATKNVAKKTDVKKADAKKADTKNDAKKTAATKNATAADAGTPAGERASGSTRAAGKPAENSAKATASAGEDARAAVTADGSEPRPPAAEDEATQRARREKLAALRARKLAEAREEASVAEAGEALSRDPEPVFAADPTAPAAPENEDREALMKRVGVKKPPAPSDDQLDEMLAALKKRAADDSDDG